MIKSLHSTKESRFLGLLFLLLSYGIVQAQSITIQGVVSSDDIPLPGVSIIIKGTNKGVVTDFDGQYLINANQGDILKFSYIGYENLEVKVKENKNINVNLIEDVNQLDEVIVIGYGTSKKEELTGAVVSLKSEDIDKVQAVSFEQALQAKAPGVQVISSEGGPGSGLKVRVRGTTSLLANADPLYVIDGQPIITEGGGNSIGTSVGLGNSFSSPLADLDPSTIESITILKDASATAVYGTRGANGVVLITTKSGTKDKPKLSFESIVGIQRIGRHVDFLSPQEYINFYNDANPYVLNDRGNFNATALIYRDNAGNTLRFDDPRLVVNDWRDQIFRDAQLRKYSLNVQGGTDKFTYAGNYSYTNQEGVIKQSDFERHAVNLRSSSTVNDKLKFDIDLNAAFVKRNGVVTAASEGSTGTQRSGIITNLAIAQPVQGRTDIRFRDRDSGEDINIVISEESGLIEEIDGRIVPNPNRLISDNTNVQTATSGRFNTRLTYEILPKLKLTTSLGGRFFINSGKAFFNRDFGFGRFSNGIAFTSNNQGFTLVNENKLQYDFKIGQHNFTTELGANQWFNTFEFRGSRTIEFSTNSVNVDNLGEGTPDQTSSGINNSTLKSGFFRARYNYKWKYFLNSTVRVDKSSRFLPGSQTGYFYALGGKWIASKEEFLKPLAPVVSNLEFKASYGITGNDRIPFGIAREAVSINPVNGGVVTRLSNRALTWETTESIDLGTQIGLFNNRVNIEASYFEKATRDLLYFLPTSSDLGLFINVSGQRVSGFFTNLGEIRNKGLELSLNATVLKAKDFSWNTNFNITFSKNKIENLGSNNDQFILNAPFEQRVNQDLLIRPGEEIGTYFGYQSDGIYRYSDFVEFDGLTDAEAASLYLQGGTANANSDADIASVRNAARVQNGDTSSSSFTLKPGVARISGVTSYRPGLRKYKDQDGDGVVDNENDRTIIARTQADHFGGLTNTFNYKNFDFSFVMNWSYGNDIYNKNRFLGTRSHLPNNNKLAIINDRFSPSNINTNVPSINGLIDVQGSNNIVSDDTYVEDGSYLRLANISLGYSLNSKLVKSLSLSQLRIYGAIDNIYVWSNYSGYDPDVSVGNNALAPGIDFDAYPRARSFRFGVKATF